MGNNWLIPTHRFDMSMSHSFGTNTKSVAVFWDTTHHIIDDTSLSNNEIQVSLMVDTSREILVWGAVHVSPCVFRQAVGFFVE